MSRNLYTIASVTPTITAQLSAGLAANPHFVTSGQAEQLLADALAQSKPFVASYQVILDGWGRALDDLASLTPGPPTSPLHTLASDVDQTGLGIIPATIQVLPIARPKNPNANAYATDALTDALNAAIAFQTNTRCDLIVLHRTLFRSFDDDEFD